MVPGNLRLAQHAAGVFKKEAIKRLASKARFTPSARNIIGLALGKLGDTRSGVGVKQNGLPDIRWCRIPAGKSRCGSTEEELRFIVQRSFSDKWEFIRERPSFPIELQEFFIGRFPITVMQFQAFVTADDGYWNDTWWPEGWKSFRDKYGPPLLNLDRLGNFPVAGVSWYEANAFCAWLSSRTNSNIYLPSEVQWERAARGNENRIFPWGNNPNAELCNVRETGLNGSCPVGLFPPTNQWGSESPQDMIGGIWEWCSTIFENQDSKVVYSYPYIRDERETLLTEDRVFRVVRGGYHGFSSHIARAAYRGRDYPDSRFDRQGFRVVKAIE